MEFFILEKWVGPEIEDYKRYPTNDAFFLNRQAIKNAIEGEEDYLFMISQYDRNPNYPLSERTGMLNGEEFYADPYQDITF